MSSTVLYISAFEKVKNYSDYQLVQKPRVFKNWLNEILMHRVAGYGKASKTDYTQRCKVTEIVHTKSSVMSSDRMLANTSSAKDFFYILNAPATCIWNVFIP